MIDLLLVLYLECGQMVIGVRQLQRKKSVRQPTNELCTRATQSKNEWYTRARQPKSCTDLRLLSREDLHIGVRQHTLKNICVAVR